MTGNMSYTNLAALASEFENASTQQVRRHTGRRMSIGSTDALYQRAMGVINMGLKLDANNPQQACEHYRTGADILAQAIDASDPGPHMEEMQRTMDMVEERVRFITHETISRSGSEASMACARMSAPVR